MSMEQLHSAPIMFCLFNIQMNNLHIIIHKNTS